jgi:hypothetical protein
MSDLREVGERFFLTLVAGILFLFLKIIKSLQWKQRSKHG